MHKSAQSAEQEQWVIWNGFFGILDLVTIGQVEEGERGREAWLEEPYDMVGPFSLDELETAGRISFAACLVMSRQKWQEDQVELRRDAHAQRRAAQARLFEEQERFNQRRGQQPTPFEPIDETQHRKSLDLPTEGKLEPSEIKKAFRRLAQKAHPDAGGSHEQFIRLTEARNALLKRVS